MAGKDRHLYVNEQLGFSLRKPDSWEFLPTAWALKARKNVALTNEELARAFELANKPFVSAYLPHNDARSAFPTLQATCRFVPNLEPSPLLDQLLARTKAQFDDVEVLESSADVIVGGAPATRIKFRFSVENASGTEFRCLTHSYAILSGSLAFTVGLSCAAHGEHAVPDELEGIASSIRIVAPRF